MSQFFLEKFSSIFFAEFLADFALKQHFFVEFLKFFWEIFSAWKRVYKILCFSTAPSVSHKKSQKLVKKVLTG